MVVDVCEEYVERNSPEFPV